MKKFAVSTLKHVLRILAYGTLGVVLTLLVVAVTHLNNRPDLSAWHKVHLDEEFSEDSGLSSFAEYRALEERLFLQLDEELIGSTPQSPGDRINRFSKGSLSDPQRWPQNWNRSYELSQDAPEGSPDDSAGQRPTAVVLLLHGLSDSPYSLHHMAAALHRQGAHVLNLRLPGHGTAPSGLVRSSWQDMAAAVRLALNHLRQQHPDLSLYVVAYSNGAALALHHELASLNDPELPKIDKLVLISPEIGVSPLARFAKTQARLGRLLGLEKLAWNDISPEYDPFKYNSFAINAGNLSYEITREIQKQIADLHKTGDLDGIAPILAFSSVVDATVEVSALVDQLFNQLPKGGHELVFFDINHSLGIEHLMHYNTRAVVEALLEKPQKAFTLHLLTNQHREDRQVELRTWTPEAAAPTMADLAIAWPNDIYSLTHLALPFPPSDSLYGGHPGIDSPGIRLGTQALRGERGVLQIPAAQMLRLRWNPFYAFLENHSLEFLELN